MEETGRPLLRTIVDQARYKQNRCHRCGKRIKELEAKYPYSDHSTIVYNNKKHRIQYIKAWTCYSCYKKDKSSGMFVKKKIKK